MVDVRDDRDVAKFHLHLTRERRGPICLSTAFRLGALLTDFSHLRKGAAMRRYGGTYARAMGLTAGFFRRFALQAGISAGGFLSLDMVKCAV